MITKTNNKFLFVRFNAPGEPTEVKARFVAVGSSELRDSAGLEDCFLKGMKGIGVDKTSMRERFAGITTDGESANAGRSASMMEA